MAQNESKTQEITVVEAVERAAIDMQIATAKQYPMHDAKHLSQVKNEMMAFATLDEETAASCFFTLPRGNKTIQGPSIRMAEIAVSCYGNLHVAARVVETVTEGDTPHVVVQAVAHDLERNVRVGLEKRRRITKKRKNNRVDEDDINLASNACISIAYRDSVFKVVPLALIKPVYEAAKRVAVGSLKSLSAKRTKVMERLQKMGVTEERILAVVGCRKVEDISGDELAVLLGLGTALKDGDVTLEHAFPPMDFYQTKDKAEKEAAAKTGSVPVDTKLGNKKPEPKPADDEEFMETAEKDPDTKTKVEKLKADLAAAEAAEAPEGEQLEKRYLCESCGMFFDKPSRWLKSHGKGKRRTEYDGCPDCKSENITDSEAFDDPGTAQKAQ